MRVHGAINLAVRQRRPISRASFTWKSLRIRPENRPDSTPVECRNAPPAPIPSHNQAGFGPSRSFKVVSSQIASGAHTHIERDSLTLAHTHLPPVLVPHRQSHVRPPVGCKQSSPRHGDRHMFLSLAIFNCYAAMSASVLLGLAASVQDSVWGE